MRRRRFTVVTVMAAESQSAPGSRGTGTAATVVVLDQFGNPFDGAKVVLRSSVSPADQ